MTPREGGSGQPIAKYRPNQQRAEAINFLKRHFPECLRHDGEPWVMDIDEVVKLIQQTRQEALREAANIAHEDGKLAVSEWLNRLASEGEGLISSQAKN